MSTDTPDATAEEKAKAKRPTSKSLPSKSTKKTADKSSTSATKVKVTPVKAVVAAVVSTQKVDEPSDTQEDKSESDQEDTSWLSATTDAKADSAEGDEGAEGSDEDASDNDESDAEEAVSQVVDPLEVSEEDEDDEENMAVFEVPKKQCLECAYLVQFATEKFKECHFTTGNKACPARSVSIVRKLDTTKIVRQFLIAEEDGNMVELSRLYLKLSKQSQWAQNQVKADLEAAKRKGS